jgi:hypothetical protein
MIPFLLMHLEQHFGSLLRQIKTISGFWDLTIPKKDGFFVKHKMLSILDISLMNLGEGQPQGNPIDMRLRKKSSA